MAPVLTAGWRGVSARRAGVILVAVGLAVHAASLAQFVATSPFADNLILDAYRYDAGARQLLEQGLRHPEAFHQAPLYLYAVAATYGLAGAHVTAVYVGQALLGGLIPFLLFRIGRRHFGDGAGIASGVLGLLYGPLLAFAPRLLPAVPGIFLLLLWLDRLPDHRTAPPHVPAQATAHALAHELSPRRDRARDWIVPGIVLGLLCLVRPDALLLGAWAIGVAIAGGVQSRRTASGLAGIPGIAVMLGAAAIVVAPVTLHHLAQGHGLVVVSSNGGETFYHGNNERAAGTYSLMAGLESADILHQETIAREIAEAESGRTLNAAGVSSFWFHKGLDFIRENPGRFLWLELQKVRLLLGANETPEIYSPKLEASRYTPLFRLAPLSLPCILPFALAGLVLAGRRPWPWLAGLLAVQIVTLLTFYVSNRYRLPLETLLLVPAGLAIARLRQRRTWLLLAPGIVFAVALVATYDRGRGREAQGMILTNLGSSLGRAGKLNEAEKAFRDAIALRPDWARSHHYLGRVYLLEERGEAAAEALARAVALAPLDPELRVDLAIALLGTGHAAEAAAQMEEAARMEKAAQLGDAAQIAERWAVKGARVWLGLGRPAQAVGLLERYLSSHPQDADARRLLDAARLGMSREAGGRNPEGAVGREPKDLEKTRGSP